MTWNPRKCALVYGDRKETSGYLGMRKRIERSAQKEAQRKEKMSERNENSICTAALGSRVHRVSALVRLYTANAICASGGFVFGVSMSSCPGISLPTLPHHSWHSWGHGLGEASRIESTIPHLWWGRKYLAIRRAQTRMLWECGVQTETSCFWNIYQMPPLTIAFSWTAFPKLPA